MKRNTEISRGGDELLDAVGRIRTLIEKARGLVAREVNSAMLQTYWEIGRVIVEQEQRGALKARYGERLLAALAKRLTRELGRGFSRSNLQNMRAFYREYSICQTTSGKLIFIYNKDTARRVPK